MELTSVVLPTPGPPVMTSTLDGERQAHRRPLALRQGQAGLPLDPGDGLVGVDRRPGRRADAQVPQPLGDLPLGPVQAGQEDAAAAPPACRRPPRRPRAPGRGRSRTSSAGISSRLCGEVHQLRRGQAAVALAPSPRPGRRRCRPAPGSWPSSRCRAWRRSGRRCGSRCRGCRGRGGRGSRVTSRTASAP